VSRPVVIDLNGDSIRGSLYFNHNSDTVVLQNGVVNYMKGVDGVSGTVRVNALDSVGNFTVGDLNVEILGGRFSQLNPVTGATVTIAGGKYTQAELEGYVAPRHVFASNTDADAASFPYKVGEGYRVTFVNYNGRIGQPGYADSVIVVNAADNKITPAPSRPAYVGADSVFANYYIDTAFRTPWNFLHDTLSSDTTLYAKWYYFESGQTHYKVTVQHFLENLDHTLPATPYEETEIYGAEDSSLTVYPNAYAGFTSLAPSVVTNPLSQDTTITFAYNRNTYTLTWNPNGGTVSGTFNPTESYLYGETIVYPADPQRTGHTFIAWAPHPILMPAQDVIISAVYSVKAYPLTWAGPDTMTYNGTAAPLSATFVDDNASTANAILTFVNAEGDSSAQAVNAGDYTVLAAPADTNYHLSGVLQKSLTILPARVIVSGIAVDTVKLYDGTATANVTANGTVSPLYGTDNVSPVTTARYDDETAGTGKTIVAFFTLTGSDAANYTPLNPSQIVTTNGVIVAPIVLDADSGANNNGIVTASGYCAGDNAGIRYVLETASTAPDQYKLAYGADELAQGFVDVAWTTIATSGQIDIVVPVTANDGAHTVTMTLRNSAYPAYESAPVTVSFNLNLNKNHTMPIFTDVISIVDTCHCIDQSTVKWYHNGSYVGDGPYYQEPGGVLTGTYHATFVKRGVTVQTCEQDDLTTLVPEATTTTATVKAYPNPVTDRVTVRIENAGTFAHTLRVMNVLGMTVVERSFDGESVDLDFSSLPYGSYTLSVDGIVTRVIKK
jgi:hypothetical protein